MKCHMLILVVIVLACHPIDMLQGQGKPENVSAPVQLKIADKEEITNTLQHLCASIRNDRPGEGIRAIGSSAMVGKQFELPSGFDPGLLSLQIESISISTGKATTICHISGVSHDRTMKDGVGRSGWTVLQGEDQTKTLFSTFIH
jgi:hypothetical protein